LEHDDAPAEADETTRVIHAERQFGLASDGATYVEKTPMPFVVPKAAAHRSSMLQVEAGRKTEIDYLNGAVGWGASTDQMPRPWVAAYTNPSGPTVRSMTVV